MNKTTEAFEAWWAETGEQSLYALNTTTDEDIKTLAGISWEAAIREALAEPVKQGPVATDLMDMLRLIETIKYLRGIAERGLGREIREDETIEQFVLGYVKQLESTQPVQEPVALLEVFSGWSDIADVEVLYNAVKKLPDGKYKLYAAPVQREWKGLTDDEIADVGTNCGTSMWSLMFAHAVIAAFKAKQEEMK